MNHKQLYRNILNRVEKLDNHHSEYKKLFQYLSKIKPLPEPNEISYEENMSSSSSLNYMNTTFMSEPIQKKIQTLHYTIQSTFQISDFKVTIHIHSNKKETFFLDQIKYVIRYLLSLFKESLTKNITINYYLLDEKKRVPNNQMIPNLHHINSGMCSYKTGKCDIHIWRKEEILKVTIHELLHGLHQEILQDTPKIISNYQSKYNISSKEININETYTEIWANILNCFLLSFSFQTDRYLYFTILLSAEKLFCSYQSHTIKKITQLGKKVIDINQYTNVLPYYIVRCELFQQLPKFLEYCRKYNKNYVIIKNKTMWQQFFQQQQQIIIPFTEPPILIKTLRMSINEIDLFKHEQIHHPYSGNEPS